MKENQTAGRTRMRETKNERTISVGKFNDKSCEVDLCTRITLDIILDIACYVYLLLSICNTDNGSSKYKTVRRHVADVRQQY
jgi:hypothetical protein